MVDLDAPPAVRRIAERLEAHGFETWAVGGAVRDALLGRVKEDWDLATRARPEDMRKLFRRTVPIGIDHGTVGVFGDDRVLYEVTTFRRDVVPMGRKAVVAFSDSIDEDLSRRDFTINAIAWHPGSSEIKDPFEGRADLERGVLRAVGDPAARFEEDYLRVLRGLRFAGHRDLEIDSTTWEALRASVSGLARLSMERVREELLKVLSGHPASRCLQLYGDSGALAVLLPEVVALDEVTLATVDRVRPHRPLLRFAAMLAGSLSSERRDREDIRSLGERLRFSNQEARLLQHVVTGITAVPRDLTANHVGRRRWMAEVGRRYLHEAIRLLIAGGRVSAESDADVATAVLAVRRDQANRVPLTVAELAAGGTDAMNLGWDRGPGLGKLLGDLLVSVWEDPALNSRERLTDLMRDRLTRESGGST